MPYSVNEVKLKRLVKAAVAEALEKRRDWVREAVADAVEDLGLIRAIRQGLRSGTVGRDAIIAILRKRP